MYGCAQVFAMPFGAGRVVCGGAAELAVYIGTFTFSECITQLLSPPTVYKVAAGDERRMEQRRQEIVEEQRDAPAPYSKKDRAARTTPAVHINQAYNRNNINDCNHNHRPGGRGGGGRGVYDHGAATTDSPTYDDASSNNNSNSAVEVWLAEEVWAPVDFDPNSASYRMKSVKRHNPLSTM